MKKCENIHKGHKCKFFFLLGTKEKWGGVRKRWVSLIALPLTWCWKVITVNWGTRPLGGTVELQGNVAVLPPHTHKCIGTHTSVKQYKIKSQQKQVVKIGNYFIWVHLKLKSIRWNQCETHCYTVPTSSKFGNCCSVVTAPLSYWRVRYVMYVHSLA